MSDICLLMAEAFSQGRLTKNVALKLPNAAPASLLSRSPKLTTTAALEPQQTPPALEPTYPEFSESGCTSGKKIDKTIIYTQADRHYRLAPIKRSLAAKTPEKISLSKAPTAAPQPIGNSDFSHSVRSFEEKQITAIATPKSAQTVPAHPVTSTPKPVQTVAATRTPSFSDFATTPLATAIAPRSGSQLYRQRLEALRAGRLYTRIPTDSFYSAWSQAAAQPSYSQWKQLLALEARAVARGQGNNRLSIFMGDSLSLWFPAQGLPNSQLWLNQGISGDTTSGILQRLSAIAPTRADKIYVMAGINDLRKGHSDATITNNLHQIMRRLRQDHPQAQVVVQSILPTRYDAIPSSRVRSLNEKIKAIARQEGVYYLDLFAFFTDSEDRLSRGLTTDGLHLNPQGYQVWQMALQQADAQLQIARNPSLTASRSINSSAQ